MNGSAITEEEQNNLISIRNDLEELSVAFFTNSDAAPSMYEKRGFRHEAAIYARCAWELGRMIETGKRPVEFDYDVFAIIENSSYPFSTMGPPSLIDYHKLAAVWQFRQQGHKDDARLETNEVMASMLRDEADAYGRAGHILGYYAQTGKLRQESDTES